MHKYIKKFSKLNKKNKISIIAIGLSMFLMILLLIFVLIPLLGISDNEAEAVKNSNEFDRMIVFNNVLSVLILLSSVTSLVFVLLGRQKHGKKKSKK
jgi:amino acid transporter